MEERLQQLEQTVAAQAAENAALAAENKLLRLKIKALFGKLFGKKSEKISSAQMELALQELAEMVLPEEPPTPPEPPRPRPRGPRPDKKVRLPEDLPTEEIIIDPEEVKQAPEAYQCIGQETTVELDVVPQQFLRRLIIRRKYKKLADRAQAPIIAPLAPRLIEQSLASVGLVVDMALKKYADHLPLYRQSQILARHGIVLSHKTLSDWMGKATWWLLPIYRQIRDDLIKTGYLQIDETPVTYCGAEEGGSRKGYLWVYRDPRTGTLLYEWHPGRGADCLQETLRHFRGLVQCDGYGGYASYAGKRDGIELINCWAHVRRKFKEAMEENPRVAGWFVRQIGQLYAVETALRGKGPALRQAVRSAESRMTIERIKKALTILKSHHLPRGLMGKAISYTNNLWSGLEAYLEDGRLEIDNNGVENAIRPTAIGRKNWLFVGHPEAGDRAAVFYTLLANCKQLGINPAEYLRDVLTRLPGMTNRDSMTDLTPAGWVAARKAKAA